MTYELAKKFKEAGFLMAGYCVENECYSLVGITRIKNAGRKVKSRSFT